MRIWWPLFGLLFLTTHLVPSARAQWVEFDDDTATRLVLNTVPANDAEEKDIAVGDLNRDGWEDLIVVRKAPFSTPGPRADVLLMNEGGILVDRTEVFAVLFGSHPTDARDVVIDDFTGDGWLDVVIANTFHQQPEFYANARENPLGDWLGFRRESASRLPFLEPQGQNPGPGPLFCAVVSGDVDMDGDPDLYFSNYNPGSTATVDKLLINDGSGFFTDQTASRLGTYANVAFGPGSQILDMNDDDQNDIIKISTLFDVPPWNSIGVFILFNDGNGVFDNLPFQTLGTTQEYMFVADHLNEDALPDMYVVQDPQDAIVGAIEVNPDGTVDFDIRAPSPSPRTANFGGNTHFADIDGDGDLDVGVAPVDVDIQNCSGVNAGEFALLQNDGDGALMDPFSPDQNFHLRPHDFAFSDIDRDGCVDIVMGLCIGYAVFRQTNCAVTAASESGLADLEGMTLRAEPNPARGLTRLMLSVGSAGEGDVSVNVYDVRGTLVRSLWRGTGAAAPASVVWDGTDDSGRRVGAGMYLTRIQSGSSQSECKVLMLR